MELFARPEIFHSPGGRISLFLGGAPAAPVFMVMMGFFLFRTKRSTASLVVRGGLLFGGGLLLNIGLNAHLLFRICLGEYSLNPWHYIFGVDILFLAGVGVAFIALFRPLLRRWLPLSFFFAMGFSFLTFVVPESGTPRWEYVTAFLWGKTSWSYFPLVPWLSWPLFGFFLGALLDRPIPKRVWFVGGGVCLAIFLLLFSFGFRISTELSDYYHQGPLYFLWGGCFVVLLMGFSSRVESIPGGAFLCWLGRHVTLAYVFQWLLIGNIATALYQSQGWDALILWFVGIVATVSLAINVWERLRFRLLSFRA